MGTFLVGRAGKETRTTFDLAAFDAFLNNSTAASSNPQPDATEAPTAQEDTNAKKAEVITPGKVGAGDAPATPPTVTVATSPSVHVNLEIHIAADATVDTVREIFRNMARYVLDKPVSDDGE